MEGSLGSSILMPMSSGFSSSFLYQAKQKYHAEKGFNFDFDQAQQPLE
jgi:hypothetical protein